MAWIIILNYNDKSATVYEVPDNLKDTQEYLENHHNFIESQMHYMEIDVNKDIEFIKMETSESFHRCDICKMPCNCKSDQCICCYE